MSRTWMRNWNEDKTREAFGKVAEEFGGYLRVDCGGNEYVLCYDHGRQVSVFHKEQVKFSFKVCGNREKVREAIKAVLPDGYLDGCELKCRISTEPAWNERPGKRFGPVLHCYVDTTAKEFYTDPIPVANCVRVFIAKLKEIDAWHIG